METIEIRNPAVEREHRMEARGRAEAKEEYAIVLDFLQHGYAFQNLPSYRKVPIAQALGKEHLMILELVPKKGIFLQPYEEVYIGEGKREKIHHVNGKIPYDKLTATAKKELEFVLEDIVGKNEKKFIEFFNRAGPLTTRMHQVELIPGIGKKHMWEILEARKEKPFENFDDIKKRVKLLPDPKKAVLRRIMLEMQDGDKHKVFVGV